ncbi:hypothetical protein MAR_028566 [Mya arenaria]|uniref:Uncharacterized protein n=1 Tax=Mya arenaria TaxID=6604 RepID=A0ABY7DFW8_MYAAR|nr:hypothetical protein MAR_028566 [Mya arenaria]
MEMYLNLDQATDLRQMDAARTEFRLTLTRYPVGRNVVTCTISVMTRATMTGPRAIKSSKSAFTTPARVSEKRGKFPLKTARQRLTLCTVARTRSDAVHTARPAEGLHVPAT